MGRHGPVSSPRRHEPPQVLRRHPTAKVPLRKRPGAGQDPPGYVTIRRGDVCGGPQGRVGGAWFRGRPAVRLSRTSPRLRRQRIRRQTRGHVCARHDHGWREHGGDAVLLQGAGRGRQRGALARRAHQAAQLHRVWRRTRGGRGHGAGEAGESLRADGHRRRRVSLVRGVPASDQRGPRAEEVVAQHHGATAIHGRSTPDPRLLHRRQQRGHSGQRGVAHQDADQEAPCPCGDVALHGRPRQLRGPSRRGGGHRHTHPPHHIQRPRLRLPQAAQRHRQVVAGAVRRVGAA
mmetsp:Transcript_2161/g.5915  ORF Transcript_2161/g.5915 Transcript_2161/m.5915 type:complete len:290 (+) Transcript_2161:851-1720(+)